MRREKGKYYSSQLSGNQTPKDMWRTLNQILPKGNKVNTGISKSLSATKFNDFFVSIAKELCSVFKNSVLPHILTPRVNEDFKLLEVSTEFVSRELSRLKSTKATGLDKIPARLLKDAAPMITKPITDIINKTFLTGKIPRQWKEAKVTPTFKAGSKGNENNYRPISVLPLFSKVMERAAQVQLLQFMTQNNVLSMFQSGFRKMHSTETAVVHLVDQILEGMDGQKLTGAVFIDLKKAFDLVNHQCLLHKLEHYGVRGQSLTWFEDYLTTRFQRVQYQNELSSSLRLDFGVPQGTILGPLLFVTYINDLPLCLQSTSIGMYADDTVLYSTGTELNNIKNSLQEDLKRVDKWLTDSQLVLNQSKTKCMLFGTRYRLENTDIFVLQLQSKIIERVTAFSYLGIILDEQLSWKEHVENVCTKASKRLSILSRIRYCLTLNAAKCVYQSVIEPVINYGDVSWGELSASCCHSLQRLQNRAARIIIRHDSSREALTLLNWTDLETNRKMHKCILIFKCLHELVPEYLSNYFVRNYIFHCYNTRRRSDLHLPKPKLTLGKRTFRYSGSVLFNTLPVNVKHAKTLPCFRGLIKTHFLGC